MAMFNTNGIWRLNGPRDSNVSLSLGCYQGMASLTMFRGPGNPPVQFRLIAQTVYKIKEFLTEIINGGPNTRTSISSSKYNQQERKYEPDVTVVLGKDEKNMIHIDITHRSMSEPARFYFTTPKSLTYGGTEMNDADRSKLAALTFIDQTLSKELPIALAHSRDAEDMKQRSNKFSNNRSGGGGNYGGGNSNGGGGNNGGGFGDSFS